MCKEKAPPPDIRLSAKLTYDILHFDQEVVPSADARLGPFWGSGTAIGSHTATNHSGCGGQMRLVHLDALAVVLVCDNCKLGINIPKKFAKTPSALAKAFEQMRQRHQEAEAAQKMMNQLLKKMLHSPATQNQKK